MPAAEVRLELQTESSCLRLSEGEQSRIQSQEFSIVRRPELQREIDLGRHDIKGAGGELHFADVDDALRKIFHDQLSCCNSKCAGTQRCIQAVFHGRRAGMIGPADKGQLVR